MREHGRVATPYGLHGFSELGHVFLAKGVEGPLDGGLIGTAIPPEGPLKRHIRAHPAVDLVESFTARKDAHEGVEELCCLLSDYELALLARNLGVSLSALQLFSLMDDFITVFWN